MGCKSVHIMIHTYARLGLDCLNSLSVSVMVKSCHVKSEMDPQQDLMLRCLKKLFQHAIKNSKVSNWTISSGKRKLKIVTYLINPSH